MQHSSAAEHSRVVCVNVSVDAWAGGWEMSAVLRGRHWQLVTGQSTTAGLRVYCLRRPAVWWEVWDLYWTWKLEIPRPRKLQEIHFLVLSQFYHHREHAYKIVLAILNLDTSIFHFPFLSIQFLHIAYSASVISVGVVSQDYQIRAWLIHARKHWPM